MNEVGQTAAATAVGGPIGAVMLQKAKAMASSNGIKEAANGVVDAFTMDICQ
jgi:hypothetical protein